jgi:hypothetical protein
MMIIIILVFGKKDDGAHLHAEVASSDNARRRSYLPVTTNRDKIVLDGLPPRYL